MQKPILAAAFVLATGSAAMAAAQEYTYAADGFAITLPSEPKITSATQTVGTTTVNRHDYSLYLSKEEHFAIIAVAIPGTENADEAGGSRANAEAAVKSLNATNAIFSAVSVSGHQGTQASYELNGKRVKNRYFLVGGRLYVLSGSAPGTATFPAAFDMALGSFRLLR